MLRGRISCLRMLNLSTHARTGRQDAPCRTSWRWWGRVTSAGAVPALRRHHGTKRRLTLGKGTLAQAANDVGVTPMLKRAAWPRVKSCLLLVISKKTPVSTSEALHA